MVAIEAALGTGTSICFSHQETRPQRLTSIKGSLGNLTQIMKLSMLQLASELVRIYDANYFASHEQHSMILNRVLYGARSTSLLAAV